MDASLEEFSAFYKLSAHMRRRIKEVEMPLTDLERDCLVRMLADYETMMTHTREMMIRYQALGLIP